MITITFWDQVIAQGVKNPKYLETIVAELLEGLTVASTGVDSALCASGAGCRHGPRDHCSPVQSRALDDVVVRAGSACRLAVQSRLLLYITVCGTVVCATAAAGTGRRVRTTPRVATINRSKSNPTTLVNAHVHSLSQHNRYNPTLYVGYMYFEEEMYLLSDTCITVIWMFHHHVIMSKEPLINNNNIHIVNTFTLLITHRKWLTAVWYRLLLNKALKT